MHLFSVPFDHYRPITPTSFPYIGSVLLWSVDFFSFPYIIVCFAVELFGSVMEERIDKFTTRIKSLKVTLKTGPNPNPLKELKRVRLAPVFNIILKIRKRPSVELS